MIPTAIILSKVPYSYREIRDAIMQVDDTKLSLENLTNMLKVVPAEEEVRRPHLSGILQHRHVLNDARTMIVCVD